MDIPSFKKTLVRAISALPRFETFNQNDLILVTAAGVIRGRPTMLKSVASEQAEQPEQISEQEDDGTRIDDEPTEAKKAILAYYADATRGTYNKAHNISESTSLPGSDGGLCLHDVELDRGNGEIEKFGELIVFYDQIIAVSIGKRS